MLRQAAADAAEHKEDPRGAFAGFQLHDDAIALARQAQAGEFGQSGRGRIEVPMV